MLKFFASHFSSRAKNSAPWTNFVDRLFTNDLPSIPKDFIQILSPDNWALQQAACIDTNKLILDWVEQIQNYLLDNAIGTGDHTAFYFTRATI